MRREEECVGKSDDDGYAGEEKEMKTEAKEDSMT